MEDVFVSYSRDDADRVEVLVNILRARGWDVWWDARITIGVPFREEIENAIRKVPCVLVLWSKRSVVSLSVLGEVDIALQHSNLIPARLDDAEIPFDHRGRETADLTDWVDGDTHPEVERIIDAVREYVDEPRNTASAKDEVLHSHECDGVADRDLVLENSHALPNEPVFKAELLTQPIRLVRMSDGQIQVTIDRAHVKHAVYTTEGKRCLCEKVLENSKVLEYARETDRELHDFLLGRSSKSDFTLYLEDLPLRWCSGGVLPIVTRPDSRGLTQEWTPFLFRDIAPGGWNIPLGASERTDELAEPMCLALREFLEEMLVLPGKPGAPNSHAVEPLTVFPLQDRRVVEQVDEFLDQHFHLRNTYDQLNLRRGSRTIELEPVKAPFRLVICLPDGQQVPRPGMLVCFNLLELGIEVVPVFRFRLNPNHYLLDGEILKTRVGDGGRISSELVRMPIVLMSHAYLRRILDSPQSSLEYGTPEMFVLPEGRQSEAQSSMRAQYDQGPEVGEIILFDWDVRCRRALARPGMPGDPNLAPASETEYKRACRWMNNFETYFFDETGEPAYAKHMEWFTPTSVKALSMYFGTMRNL